MKFESLSLDKFKKSELGEEYLLRFYGGNHTSEQGLTAVVTAIGAVPEHPGTDMRSETDTYEDEVIA